MNYGYSDTLPEPFEQRGDELIHRYGIEKKKRKPEKGGKQETYYEFKYVVVQLPDNSPAIVKYYNLVAAKVNAKSPMEEQIGILRKYIAGLHAQVAHLAKQQAVDLPANKHEQEFSDFNSDVESAKRETKGGLGIE